ncbi:MAG: hypothetical protein O7B99_13855 [Planctomycetota bacterium]|nr:hypothetical protein [Planctomycetota bacterium]
MICTALLGAAALLGGPVDSEVAPYPFVAATQHGRAYFKMLPDPKGKYDRDKGSGTVYEVKAVGPDEALWSVEGWYAYDVFLANDGEHVIRMGNWPQGQEPEQADLAVAFYRKDRLLASYSTADVILDPSKVRPSVSHYMYRGEVPVLDRRAMQLRLVSVDRVEWIFDVTTGKVVSQKQLPPK